MVQKCRWRTFALCSVLAPMWGCGPQGTVGQGRVVGFADPGRIIVIEDSNPADPANPRYDVLPPKVIAVPKDSRSMGPMPAAGGLLRTDLARRELVIFEAATQALRTIPYTVVRQQDGVYKSDPQLEGKHFPLVDRKAKTITLYSSKRRTLLTISVPDEFLALPEDTWSAGDEVRYYFKAAGQALRLMNLTRTDIV